MKDKEKIEFLEKENEMLKEQIKLLKQLLEEKNKIKEPIVIREPAPWITTTPNVIYTTDNPTPIGHETIHCNC